MPIIVEIEEARRDRPTSARDSCFGGHVRKRSVAIVVIKDVSAVARDEQVRKAVVVIIADCDTHAIVARASLGQTCGFGHVRKAAILVLAVEPIPVARAGAIKFFRQLHRTRHTPAIYQENVEQTVVVVIEQGDAAGHGFNEVFLRRGRIL